ncbi:MAG: hypothetical protein FJZ92_07970 [Chloroflexi bacterium]|nr:hypothetical protein [Chloroflexota bacterium]
MRARIRAIMPYELHGTRYYQIVFVPEGQQRPQQARLSHDMVLGDPQPGDLVDVHAILGIVDRVQRLDEGAAAERES